MHWSHEFDEVMDKLGWPDLGDRKVWRWWFARSLSMLEQHGWFELLRGELGGLTTGELTSERDTIFALRWLAEDYCSVIDSYGYEPDWHDWFDALEIPRWGQIPAARDHKAWNEVICIVKEELGIPDDPSEYVDEDTKRVMEEELDASLTTQSMLLVIAEKRRSIVRLLIKTWGGHHRLYQSLFAAVHSSDSGMVECDDDDLYLDDEVEEVAEDAGKLEKFEKLLERWRGMEVNELANEALQLPNSLADLGEKLSAHGWVYEDCPIRVQGSPQFYAIGDFM